MRPALRWRWRFLAALVAFAATLAMTERTVTFHAQDGVRRLGVAAGCDEVYALLPYIYVRDGFGQMPDFAPFFGGSWRDTVFNWGFVLLPPTSAYVLALVVSLAVYHMLTFRRTHRDGHTRCGFCGYILKGLTEPRCPECGVRI